MAIRINNTTVIDDQRNGLNINSIRFSDGTSITKRLSYGETVESANSLKWTLNNPNVYGSSDGDQFGDSVAIFGDYMAVGSWREEVPSGIEGGAVYVFSVKTGTLLYVLNNPNAYSTSAGDHFGVSLAIDGNYLIVGANTEDDSGGSDSGKAYIFNVTTGALLWTLNNPNAYGTSNNDQFGNPVKIRGNYACIGATAERDLSGLSSGKVYVFNVTTGALVWTLNNPNAYSVSEYDYFGSLIDLDENYVIVSSPTEDNAQGVTVGAVYIFSLKTGFLEGQLVNPQPLSSSVGNVFGSAISICNNKVLIGARSTVTLSNQFDSGKAYLYDLSTRNGDLTMGNLLLTLENPSRFGAPSGNYFGFSAAATEKYLIVGSYGSDNSSGVIYVFDYSGNLIYTIQNPSAYSTAVNDNFGRTLSASGNYIITGAILEDDVGGSASGKAYVFSLDATQSGSQIEEITFTNGTTLNLLSDKAFQVAYPAGALVHTLNNPNAYSTSLDDWFGVSAAISGNYAIVGAYQEDDAQGSRSGKAYIFNVTTGQLVWTLNNPNAYSTGAIDDFGSAVAISGNYALVGAYAEDDANAITLGSSGKAYIFNVTTGQLVWTLNNPNAFSTSETDFFGYYLAISGNYAIVSAYAEDDAGGTSSGSVYIYDVTTGALIRTLANPTAYGTSAGDQFGWSVSISDNHAIIGAYTEGDAGGISSGKAYIYNVITGQLVWTLNNPNAYSTSDGDYFAFSVGISGNYAIASAIAEDDVGGSFSGKAYIYNVTTGQLVWTLNNPNGYSTSDNDQFGYVVSISGKYAIATSHLEDDAGGTSSGKAYIFDVTTGTLVQTLDNPNAYSTSLSDQFGYYAAISGNYVIVTSRLEDDFGGTSSGKAYIFSINSQTYLDRLLTLAEGVF